MKEDILKDLQLNAGASDEEIRNVVSETGHSLPKDYLEFLHRHNGGEGFVADNYLILWRAEELRPFNQEYEVEQYAPGILLFGSDGGGEGYGFDTRDVSMPIVQIPFIGMELRYARNVGNSFTDFLQQLSK